jgi:hypothetical protein
MIEEFGEKPFGGTGRILELKLPEYRPIFYTDELKGKQVCRDDLWAVSTDELNAIYHRLTLLEKVTEIAAKRPNKMGPHYMIWMDTMDAAILAALKGGK